MYEWLKNIQAIVDEIDACIKKKEDDAVSLTHLAQKLGYSEYYVSKKVS